MADFTLKKYKKLLDALVEGGYAFTGFEDYISSPGDKPTVILRHDVDLHPERAAVLAEIEASKGIKASYHFRTQKSAFSPEIISKVIQLKHEIAYHYEDLSSVVKESRHLLKNPDEACDLAYSRFVSNLSLLRQLFPVRVISMHGDPLSTVDNRDLWRSHDYKAEGVRCEVYLDIDYSEIMYLTDTGRRWNAFKTNIRDRAKTNSVNEQEQAGHYSRPCKSTDDVINLICSDDRPRALIINTHPQRWTSRYLPWVWELVWQNTKNVIKYFIGRLRRNRVLITQTKE